MFDPELNEIDPEGWPDTTEFPATVTDADPSWTVGVTLIVLVETLALYVKVQPENVGDKVPDEIAREDILASKIITLFEFAVVDPTEFVFVTLKFIALPASLA